jgi:hypothetical protein
MMLATPYCDSNHKEEPPAREVAEKVEIATAAPKGAVETERFTASLKRCPDTKHELFRKL